MGRSFLFLVGVMVAMGGVCAVVAQDRAVVEESPDAKEATAKLDATKEIEFVIAAYMESFHAQNVDALLEHWTPEGVYVNRTTGERTVGREELSLRFLAHRGQQEDQPKENKG